MGPNTYVAEKTTTKHSSLGGDCKVEEKVRAGVKLIIFTNLNSNGCFKKDKLLVNKGKILV